MARRTGPAAYTEELRELLVRLLPALRDALAPLASLATLVASPARLDEHGMDPDLLQKGRAVLDFFLGTWWRVDVQGADLLPDQPFVLVANHGGTAPWDAVVLRAVLARQVPQREVRPLLDPASLSLALLGPLLVRLGAAPLRPEVALTLLGRGSSVAVFPEGRREGPPPWADRYRLVRFGALAQVTALSLTGGFGRDAARPGAWFVERRWAQLLATDAHNTFLRSPVLGFGLDAARRLVGEEEARALLDVTPRALVEGRDQEVQEPGYPEPPKRTFLSRLFGG
jgi:hypothetical protein